MGSVYFYKQSEGTNAILDLPDPRSITISLLFAHYIIHINVLCYVVLYIYVLYDVITLSRLVQLSKAPSLTSQYCTYT